MVKNFYISYSIVLYITDDISVDEYQDYINFINGSKISFNEMKVVISTFREKKREFFEIREENIIEHFKVRMYHFPYDYYVQLGPNSKEIVDRSEKGEYEFYFIIGRSLIEGLNDFPFDLKIGLDYIKKSIKNGNKESLIYYIKMLIKGKCIPQNLVQATELIDQLNQEEYRSTYFNLVGQIFKKEGQFEKSKINFKRSIDLGNADSLYQYAKLLEENLIPINQTNEIDHYLKLAISKGCQKAMIKYSVKLFRQERFI